MYIPTYAAMFLWIFALFGFFYFLLRVIDTLLLLKQSQRRQSYILISVKNQEENIEGLVRSLIFEAGAEGKEDICCKVLLLDNGSIDQTPQILEKLAEKYSFIRIIKSGEINDIIKNLMT